MHDYYTADVASYDHEDNQSSYESENCDVMVTGPIIASPTAKDPTRDLTYNVNVKEAGTYKMTLYYAGGAGMKAVASLNGTKLAENSKAGTGNSDPNKCNKVVIDGINLPSGDIMLKLECTATGSGYFYAYYFELVKTN